MAGRKISPAEPVTELRRIPIRENGEPLVDFLELCPELRLDRPRFTYRRETVMRKEVAERLCRANEALMRNGLRIQVIEGWRAPLIQRRMYGAVWKQFKDLYPDRTDASLTRIVNRYSAPMNLRVPPPHTTGGAMDVTLTDLKGRPLDVHSPFDWLDPRGFAFDAEGISDRARKNRDLLREAMTGAGLTNYPSEYWHWSYGDQGWAYRGGHPFALYGAIEPPGWTPDPKDVTDEPLEFVSDL
ncbi:M15 family metallopeptidase [Fimbriimonas ginsengisoli]|uniref:D-alanyl-D-alanine dipeptidase n=1 Tax=Fimbriimonas ginsengisoli Gsoil 348 TaxID=661478 RepID=A0A068NM97_FIMGI|nr:M15 family metallopeptidase [Fimbriimonas ginsengisoli]AIE83910.1 putative D-Ala-D-Ala dipeptidase [Fimbriimonas ginsengisoli Gsoil 348]